MNMLALFIIEFIEVINFLNIFYVKVLVLRCYIIILIYEKLI